MSRGPWVGARELATVGTLVSRGFSDGAIAERLGRSRFAVRRWRLEILGLRPSRGAQPRLGRCRWTRPPKTTEEVWSRAAVVRAGWSEEERAQRAEGRALGHLARRFGQGPEFDRLAVTLLGRHPGSDGPPLP